MPEESLTNELAEAIIVPLGRRGFNPGLILPPGPWKTEEWTIVVFTLGELQDWIEGDTFQMMCGTVYWVPKCLRNTEWLYHQLMRMETANNL